METDQPIKLDPFDIGRLRLPPGAIGSLKTRRLPRHRPGEAFLKGPIPYAWISTASRLPGSGLHVATAVRFLRGRYRRTDRWSIEDIAEGLGLSVRSAQRGLHAAEEAGLVSVSREPGCKPSLAVLDFNATEPDPERPPLYGPIPWTWLSLALRLPGPSLSVAMVCWFVAGTERAAAFKLVLGEWASFGLSRQAAGRGLDSLESAGLLSVTLRPGKSPVVIITDPPHSPTRKGPRLGKRHRAT